MEFLDQHQILTSYQFLYQSFAGWKSGRASCTSSLDIIPSYALLLLLLTNHSMPWQLSDSPPSLSELLIDAEIPGTAITETIENILTDISDFSCSHFVGTKTALSWFSDFYWIGIFYQDDGAS